jgi:glycosyltransferase involved in cell wall biosynthesis
MIKLSVIIPSYKDPLLQKTIDNLLERSELGDQLEIIAVYDGYWPDIPIKDDPRVRIVHLGQNRGMRGAINAGVAVSRGEFIMRTDEHCVFGKGYDRILTETCEPNWIVTARRFFLDPVKWEVMNIPPVDYEKLVIQDGVKFSGQRWYSRTKERKDIMIDETMAMQGSMWVMPRSWWDKVIVELDTEHYGPLIQDSHEMQFKTWQAGGKLMLNKNTWFAHKHRSFPRTHNNGTTENPASCEKGYAYALSQWKDYYEKEIVPRWFK